VASGISSAGKWVTPSSRLTENHGLAAENFCCPARNSAARRHEDHMHVEHVNQVPAAAVVRRDCHRPMACCGVMQVRYRYRIYPSPGQQQALARVFGCARVVYNDCLRLRDACHAAGEKISDTEVQRRVITLAKCTPERVWLGEVASVALVQACQDARRAYRNWFDSLKSRRKGPKIRHPKPRRKHGRQSIRLTRNGFALHGERLYVAKVGDVRVEWSRPLPSVPSSVAVLREPDGRYYASFVVEREAAPLPACDREPAMDQARHRRTPRRSYPLLAAVVLVAAGHAGAGTPSCGSCRQVSRQVHMNLCCRADKS